MIFPCSKLNVRPAQQFEFDIPVLCAYKEHEQRENHAQVSISNNMIERNSGLPKMLK